MLLKKRKNTRTRKIIEWATISLACGKYTYIYMFTLKIITIFMLPAGWCILHTINCTLQTSQYKNMSHTTLHTILRFWWAKLVLIQGSSKLPFWSFRNFHFSIRVVYEYTNFSLILEVKLPFPVILFVCLFVKKI